jgi:glycosyltransferase involved in cell wall biosynthesis
LPLAAARNRLDVVLNPGCTAPILCGCPMVTVFHDLQHKRHPEYFRWFDLPFWRILLFAAAHVSRIMLVISEATETDLFRYYRLPRSKVRVVRLGVDPHLFGVTRVPEPFLLSVSTLHPHKNQGRLLEAFARFRRVCPAFRLVLAGIAGFASAKLERLRADLKLEDAVEFTGWMEREALRDLYRRAHAVVYPTLFEGFGLPILEALAAGVPTACSAIEPVSGLAGDAALQFDPYDVDAITTAMLRVVSDEALRHRLSAAGPLQAAKYSWTATAQGTLKALRAAAASDPNPADSG